MKKKRLRRLLKLERLGADGMNRKDRRWLLKLLLTRCNSQVVWIDRLERRLEQYRVEILKKVGLYGPGVFDRNPAEWQKSLIERIEALEKEKEA